MAQPGCTRKQVQNHNNLVIVSYRLEGTGFSNSQKDSNLISRALAPWSKRDLVLVNLTNRKNKVFTEFGLLSSHLK